MKTCTQCGAHKELAEFAKAKTCADGTRSYCKTCHSGRKRDWRHRNKEHHRKKCRMWAEANPEKRKDVLRRSNKKRQVEGKTQISARAWWVANREKCVAALKTRRESIYTATPKWVSMVEIQEYYKKASSLGLTVDHIIPIKNARVCGLHVIWNLQMLSRSDNSKKGSRYDGDME